jgi:hypothetical protein
MVIVDMQEHFRKSYHRNQRQNLIDSIHQHRGSIIVVQLTNSGLTERWVLKAARDKLTAVVTKPEDDGSPYLVPHLTAAPAAITVCGVNTPYCVMATAYGLSYRYPKTRVIVPPTLCGTFQDTKDQLITVAAVNVWYMSDPACQHEPTQTPHRDRRRFGADSWQRWLRKYDPHDTRWWSDTTERVV